MKKSLFLASLLLLTGCDLGSSSTQSSDNTISEAESGVTTLSEVEEILSEYGYDFVSSPESISTQQKIVLSSGGVSVSYGLNATQTIPTDDLTIVKDAYDHYILVTFSDKDEYKKIAKSSALVLKHDSSDNFVGFANIPLLADEVTVSKNVSKAFQQQVVVNNPNSAADTVFENKSVTITYQTDLKNDNQPFSCTNGSLTINNTLNSKLASTTLNNLSKGEVNCYLSNSVKMLSFEVLEVEQEAESVVNEIENAESNTTSNSAEQNTTAASSAASVTSNAQASVAATVTESTNSNSELYGTTATPETDIDITLYNNYTSHELNLTIDVFNQKTPVEKLEVTGILTDYVKDINASYRSNTVLGGTNKNLFFGNIPAPYDYDLTYVLTYEVRNIETNATEIIYGRKVRVYGTYR